MPHNSSDLKSLFDFYYDYVKPLYASASSDNEMPQEVLFEINAAFDHLSRHWKYGEEESSVVSYTFGHLKRSCLDIFKLRYKQTKDQYDELVGLDLSLIDNGQFDSKFRAKFYEIKNLTNEARNFESQNTKNNIKPPEAFDRWYPVYEQCLKFEKDYYYNQHIDWAKKTTTQIETQIEKGINRAISFRTFLIGCGSSLFVGLLLFQPLYNLIFDNNKSEIIATPTQPSETSGVAP